MQRSVRGFPRVVFSDGQLGGRPCEGPTSGAGHEAQDQSLLWPGDLVGRLEHLLGGVHLVSLRAEETQRYRG